MYCEGTKSSLATNAIPCALVYILYSSVSSLPYTEMAVHVHFLYMQHRTELYSYSYYGIMRPYGIMGPRSHVYIYAVKATFVLHTLGATG